MPLVDLPLDQLWIYQGRNPRPDDFDEYWESALKELAGCDPEIECVPHDSPAKFADCFDLTFTGVGNARLYAKYVRPKQASLHSHPAVVEFHGYSASSCDWTETYKWAAQGISFFALDVRGQGGKSEDTHQSIGNTLYGHIIRGLHDRPEKLLYRSIFLDCVRLAQIAMTMPEVDPLRVGTIGASQGGGLALACAALEPQIKRTVAFFPFLCDYQRVWEMDLACSGAYSELRDYFRRFDPNHQREEEAFLRLGYIDVQYLAPKIRADVLFGTGLMDTICPPSTQFAAYNKITSPKSMAIYPDFGHEGLPGFNDRAYQFLCEL